MTRLRFSIRDLLWLTLVVALAVGWAWNAIRVRRLERERQEFDAIINSYRQTMSLIRGEKPEAKYPPIQIKVD